MPEDAQLKGGGWLASFKKVYEIQVVDWIFVHGSSS